MKRNPFALPSDTTLISIVGQNDPWREVLHLAKRKIYAKNEYMLCGNNTFLYFINKGCVRLERVGISGEENFVLYFKNGCFFNDVVSIIHPGKTRKSVDCNFHFLEKTEAYAFHSDILCDEKFIVQYPHLIYNLLRSVAYKTYIFLHSATDCTHVKPIGCVCRVLYEFYISQGYKNIVKPNISQTELCKILRISRTSMCRIIKRLRNDNIIGKYTSSCLEILDAEKLSDLTKGRSTDCLADSTAKIRQADLQWL